MSPTGLPGLLVVAVVFIGVWSLFPQDFLPVVSGVCVVGLVLALVLREWRARHPSDKSLLHLKNSEPASKDDSDA